MELGKRSFLGLFLAFLFALIAPKQVWARRRAINASSPELRMMLLGIGDNSMVGPGESRTYATQAQDSFAPRRFTVPASVAPNFGIKRIKIGRVVQTEESIQAEAFVPQNFATLELDTAHFGDLIQIEVTNIGNEPAKFRSVLHGFVTRTRPRYIAREMSRRAMFNIRQVFTKEAA